MRTNTYERAATLHYNWRADLELLEEGAVGRAKVFNVNLRNNTVNIINITN